MTCKTKTSFNLNLNRNLNVSPSITTSFTNPNNILTRRLPCRYPIKSCTANPSRLSNFLRFDSSIRRLELCPPKKRRRFTPSACSSELPLLPFPMDQVLVPSESKTLHLFEARYLALLEESLFRKKKLFVHFVLDPIAITDTSAEASFAARYGCLVVVEKVEQLDVGALVSIRGIGRVTIVKFVQADPYLKGVVIPLQDNVPDSVSKISSKVMEIKEALYSLNSLEIKLKASKEALLQTQIVNSLMWAEKEPSLDCDDALVPSFAEHVSFAALQPVSEELHS